MRNRGPISLSWCVPSSYVQQKTYGRGGLWEVPLKWFWITHEYHEDFGMVQFEIIWFVSCHNTLASGYSSCSAQLREQNLHATCLCNYVYFIAMIISSYRQLAFISMLQHVRMLFTRLTVLAREVKEHLHSHLSIDGKVTWLLLLVHYRPARPIYILLEKLTTVDCEVSKELSYCKSLRLKKGIVYTRLSNVRTGTHEERNVWCFDVFIIWYSLT